MKCRRSRSRSHCSSTRLPARLRRRTCTSAILRADQVIVLGDVAAVAHVDEHHLDRRDAGAARDRDIARPAAAADSPLPPARAPAPSRRTAARRGSSRSRRPAAGSPSRARARRCLRDLAPSPPLWKYVRRNGNARRLSRPLPPRARANSLQPPPAGQQAHAGLDQADVALERRDRAVAVHDELAAAAERHARRTAATVGTIEYAAAGRTGTARPVLDFGELARHQLIGDVQLRAPSAPRTPPRA